MLEIIFRRATLTSNKKNKIQTKDNRENAMKKLLSTASLFAILAVPAFAEGTKIGVITTLSGPAGYLGEQIRDGLTLGLQATGAAFELVVEDDGRDPNTGVQAADRMVNEDGIKLVTGIVFSNVSGAVVPEVLDAGAIYVSPNAAPSPPGPPPSRSSASSSAASPATSDPSSTPPTAKT